MSLGAILSSASSGLYASQTQLRLVSDNISNVNTPGYARKTAQQTSVTLSDMGGGVTLGRVTRAVDQFLTQASYAAMAQSGGASMLGDVLDRAQGLFGDPSSDSGYFNQLDQAFASFASAAQDPASTVGRNQALTAITSFLDQSEAINAELTRLSQESSRRINEGVTKINTLVEQIDQLNKKIIADTASGSDSSGAENSQGQLLNELAAFVDIGVTRRSDGGIDVRSGDGSLLVGRQGPSTLTYSTTGSAPGQIMVASPNTTARPMLPNDGMLHALMTLRNQEIPAIQSQMGEYVTRAADEINRAHNASSAVPPPNVLSGRNTGLDLPTALSGFTGKTTVAVVDSAGVLQTRVDIDFDAGTMSADGGPAFGFTTTSFLTVLNGRLGANGSASFANGALRIQASAGDGVTISDDATTPSQKIGRGFSHFFGLNDLISSTGFPYTATGLKPADPHGFTAGGVVSLRLLDDNGAAIRDAAVTIPAAATMTDLLTALNSTSSGVGLFGAFSLDAEGRMLFTPSAPGVNVSVISDTSERGTNGPSVTQLFGISPNLRAQRAANFSLRADIAGDSTKLSLAQFNQAAVAGQSALSKGDARGALALAAAGETNATFDPAGSVGALTATLSQYGAQMSGSVAQRAMAATTLKLNAESVAAEAEARRASIEGVNLDEELIKLTTFQQSYNASARLIQAVNELFDTLMRLA